MADLVKISDGAALAIHSMIQLAIDYKRDRLSTTAEISELFGASRHHLAKVHQRLTRVGLIHSSRGPAGGVALAKDPAQITLLDVYEAIDGPMDQFPCLFGRSGCPRCDCTLSGILPSISELTHNYFGKTTLAELAEKSKWENPDSEHLQ
ncbi:MAG TPA: Rrf2 family transcriptional regulator [Pontiella sp.]